MGAAKGHPPFPGAGRPKGSPNKATAEVKAIALKHLPVALAELARLALKADSEQTRVSAIKELLDRGIGKSPNAPEDNEAAAGLVARVITGLSAAGGPKRG